MGTSAADDPESEGTWIAETLDRTSQRFREGVDKVKPNNPDLWVRGIKVVLSLLLTAMYVYWILAWQFDVQLFEF
jgi:hypothetical protein